MTLGEPLITYMIEYTRTQLPRPILCKCDGIGYLLYRYRKLLSHGVCHISNHGVLFIIFRIKLSCVCDVDLIDT